MKQYEQKLLDAIDEIVTKRIEQQCNYNKTIKAKIKTVLTAPQYEITYLGETFVAKAINGSTYLVDDVVYVLIVNNNFNDKLILCLVP